MPRYKWRRFGFTHEINGAWSWRTACHDAIDIIADTGIKIRRAFDDHWFHLSPGWGRFIPWMDGTECSSCGTITGCHERPASGCCRMARRAAYSRGRL